MLVFEQVSFGFERREMILHDISFSVTRGEMLLLAGPNGSGKTVLMKHCNGLLRPSAGCVRFMGKPVKKQITHVRQKIGIVFQNSDTQFVGQTVSEDIAFGPENLGWKQERIDEAVQRSASLLGITHILEKPPHFLSGGEKKRVAIAGIIAMDPDIIILDEPFAGLDYQGVCALTREIVALKKSNHTLMIITHDVEKIAAHVDRMIILNTGRITYDGLPTIENTLLSENSIRVPYGESRTVESCTWL